MVHNLGKGKYIIQSIPGELNMEHTNILTIAAETEDGFVTSSMLINKLGY